MLGMRLPFGGASASSPWALAFGSGRELLGRQGAPRGGDRGQPNADPLHLGQFARGYTAMLAGLFASSGCC